MRTLFCILTFILACSAVGLASESNKSTESYKSLKVFDVSKKLSSGKIGWLDVIAIGDELYLAYRIRKKRNHYLVRMKSD